MSRIESRCRRSSAVISSAISGSTSVIVLARAGCMNVFYPIAIPSGEGMKRRTLFVAIALSGCSQLFGLDKPVRSDATVDVIAKDSDGDGVTDDADNCDNLANPDQVDVDRDDIGDACQGCIMLPLRAFDDDDGDGLTDDIDNCTGLASGTMQSDDDGDGIGNGCDPRAGVDKRFCLWTFRDAVPPESASVWTERSEERRV